jgi:hypothetical protein
MRVMRYPRRVTATDAIEFDATIDGRDALIGFTRHTVGGWENYGSDADGRRGVMRFDHSDNEPTGVTLAFYDDDARALAATPFDALDTTTQTAVEAAIVKYIATHEPDFDEHEPDYDDVDD